MNKKHTAAITSTGQITLPETALDWKGEETYIQWPKGRCIANSGNVYLFRQKKDVYAVVYGLQIMQALDRDTAASEFGQSVFHQAECNGLID